MSQTLMQSTKRGDTLIEVMFAFAVFALVAIMSVTMMNLGLAASERSLEVVTVRNEINAQAEALRFIHSSYIAELNLPRECGPDAPKCQQFAGLWGRIISYARDPANSPNEDKRYSIELPVNNCTDVGEPSNSAPYINEADLLVRNNAFVINTRRLSAQDNITDAYIAAMKPTPTTKQLFYAPSISARIIYSKTTGDNTEDGDPGNSTTTLTDNVDPLLQYTRISRVEGIWVVAVKSSSTGTPQYYDFYIGSCWYGSNSPSPSSIDTVVRLYSPEKS